MFSNPGLHLDGVVIVQVYGCGVGLLWDSHHKLLFLQREISMDGQSSMSSAVLTVLC